MIEQLNVRKIFSVYEIEANTGSNNDDNSSGDDYLPPKDADQRYRHIFENENHKMDIFLQKEKAFEAIQKVANRALSENKLVIVRNGMLPTGDVGNIINVDGLNVQLMGARVINGNVIISSASRKIL